jgi:hypothetical protein
MAQLAYLEMFRRLDARRPELGRGAVFTTINRASILSFRRVGLQYEPLMGRTDFHTPEQELGKDFLPVTIPYNEQNIAVFHSMGEGVPELVL